MVGHVPLRAPEPELWSMYSTILLLSSESPAQLEHPFLLETRLSPHHHRHGFSQCQFRFLPCITPGSVICSDTTIHVIYGTNSANIISNFCFKFGIEDVWLQLDFCQFLSLNRTRKFNTGFKMSDRLDSAISKPNMIIETSFHKLA